jgi:hypothetical protein
MRKRSINPTKAICITLNQSVIDTLELILTPNQSRSKFIQIALVEKLNGSPTIADSDTRWLMAALSARPDCDPYLKQNLMQILLSKSS